MEKIAATTEAAAGLSAAHKKPFGGVRHAGRKEVREDGWRDGGGRGVAMLMAGCGGNGGMAAERDKGGAAAGGARCGGGSAGMVEKGMEEGLRNGGKGDNGWGR